MNSPTKLNRTELEKYYKKVKECVICKEDYGIDGSEQNKDVCPTCIQNKLKQRFMGFKSKKAMKEGILHQLNDYGSYNEDF